MLPNNNSLVIQREFTLEMLEDGGAISFMNFASLEHFFTDKVETQISYFCDGGLMSLLCSLITKKKVTRVSFDYTSIANEIFESCSDNNKSLYLVGAKDTELKEFVRKLKVKHAGINVIGSSHGYFESDDDVVSDICKLSPDIVVVGLGAGKQEKFLCNLFRSGFKGSGFSCGGFIRQQALSNKEEYYPNLINRLKLRFAYRMYKEPHTIRRYLLGYPINSLKLLTYVLLRKITVIAK